MNKDKKFHDISNRSSLPLQICIWLNAYVFLIWSTIYGFSIIYKFKNFWNLEGIFIITAFIAAIVFEFVRQNAGYSGNLKAKPMHLNRFLILTPLIILPLLLFLLLSTRNFHVFIFPLTYLLFALMLMEFIFGVITWKKLCAYQSEIYKLKRDMVSPEVVAEYDQKIRF